jgi:hypothetical protein
MKDVDRRDVFEVLDAVRPHVAVSTKQVAAKAWRALRPIRLIADAI